MSTPHRHLPPLQVRERAACMCVHGESCSSFAPGHALHLIQARLASATPSEWVDAIVESSDAENGVVFVRTLVEGELVELWNGSGAAREVVTGAPGRAARPLRRARRRVAALQHPAGLVRPQSCGGRQAIFIMLSLSAMQASMHALQD